MTTPANTITHVGIVTRLRLAVEAKSEREGLSLRKVAGQMGVNPSSLSRWLRGNCLPDLPSFAKVCQWLQMDPAILLGVEIGETIDAELEER